MAQAREQLRRNDYGAIALVLKHELSATADRAVKPVCIRGPVAKTPPRSLLQYLIQAGIEVSGPNACYLHGAPRGMEVRLSNFRRGLDSSLSISVETGRSTPEPGVHVGELLRLGTYQLKQTDNNKWEIVSYTNERPVN
jgi:hypothetical protein